MSPCRIEAEAPSGAVGDSSVEAEHICGETLYPLARQLVMRLKATN